MNFVPVLKHRPKTAARRRSANALGELLTRSLRRGANISRYWWGLAIACAVKNVRIQGHLRFFPAVRRVLGPCLSTGDAAANAIRRRTIHGPSRCSASAPNPGAVPRLKPRSEKERERP
jgi:hypothetical protein